MRLATKERLTMDAKLLQLMQVLMKSQKEGRVFELASQVHHPKILQNAVQLAHAHNLTTLAESLDKVIEDVTDVSKPESKPELVERPPKLSSKRPHQSAADEDVEDEEVEDDVEQMDDDEEPEDNHEEIPASQRVPVSPMRPHTRASPVKRARLAEEATDAEEQLPQVTANPFAKNKREPLSAARGPRPGFGIAKSLGDMNKLNSGKTNPIKGKKALSGMLRTKA